MSINIGNLYTNINILIYYKDLKIILKSVKIHILTIQNN